MPSDKPAVSVHIVTWNSVNHIPSCLDSLTRVTYQPMDIFMVDNASADGTVTWIQEHYPHIHLLRNTRNLGFCRAHNQAIRLTSAPYILLLNPDIVVSPNWIERAVTYMETHPEAGSFGGKLRRYVYSQDELKEVQFSGIIDSVGLSATRQRHIFDRGSEQEDTGQFDQAQEVFGHSGACVLLRRSALESIRYKDEYLDEDFFAYKDDADLAWRLQRLGWTSWYDPETVAYHHRTIQGQSKASDIALARQHRSRSAFNSFYSLRNHWLLLQKHERRQTWWRDWPWIVFYEAKKIVYHAVTHPSVLRAIPAAWRLSSRMKQKARLLDRQAKVSVETVRQRWFLPT